jgi:hypothetical protein
MAQRSDFLLYIQAAYDRESGQLESEIDKWRSQFDPNNSLFGYSPPGWPLSMASVAAFLFEQSGDRKLAETARDILLRYREWTRLMPPEATRSRPEYADGISPIEPVFQPLMFVPAAERIRKVVSEQNYQQLMSIVADSEKSVLRFPEWGGHNRAMLRAAGLALSARAFSDHPEAANWVKLADELAEESWGRWSVEDAQMYQSHWLRAMILYSEGRGKPEISSFIQPRLVLKSIVQLLTPLGSLPDYGDSHWMMHSQWEWLACLEWGAHVYQDPTMKWAANRIWEQRQVEPPTLYGANVLTYAWRWSDDQVKMQEPGPILDALDDLVVKKSVFRTGWDKDATYGLFNYRDEGDYAQTARDYLRTTLAVSAEKMHHGHADEGSLSVLIHKGTVLLHESGYRDSPPDGMYRSDVYHNRLVWRPGEKLENGTWVEFLRGNGFYKKLRTERLYQTKMGDAEITRLRVRDEGNGISWDRSIFFLAALPCFVVIDTVFEKHPELRTYSSMWWSMEVLNRGQNWFETYVSHFVDWQNPRNAGLLLVFPQLPDPEYHLEIERARRSYQEETAIETIWTGRARKGKPINFVTVLWPHDFDDQSPARAAAIKLVNSRPMGRGVGVSIDWQGTYRLLTTLNDLTVSWLQEDIRPRYRAENGRAIFGPVSSDAAFTYTRKEGESISTGLINGTRLAYNGRVVFQALECGMFQESATQMPGIAARFRWEGTV